MTAVALPEIVDELLEAARGARARRAARTVEGNANALRQTVIALLAGAELNDHESPGAATLQVLRGRVRLTSADGDWTGVAGDLTEIPPVRHGLHADEDSAVLLTVALLGVQRAAD